MIKTTAAYKEAIKKNRIFHHEVNINFADQTSIPVGDVDLFAFQLLDATSNTGSFDIGSAIAQQLLLKLNNVDGKFDNHDFSDAVITAKIGLELSDNSIEWLNKGIFKAEPGTVSGDTISVNAFDNMVKFDADYSQSKLVYPATLGAIVRDACSCCDVTLAPDSATFDKDDYIVQNRPNDSALTFRQVLQFVGQIACKFFKINTEGKLSVRWYDIDTFESIDIDNVDTEKIILIDELHTGSTLQTDDVVITGVKVIEENRDEENSSSEVTYKSGTDGYVLEVSGNKLIQGGEGAEVVNYLGECLNGLQFRPVSINASTDPCRESGDLAVVIDSKGNKYKTIFTNVNYVAHTAQALICGAEVPARLSSTRYSQATQVYKEIRANIRKYRSEWSAAFKELQTAMDSKNGLFPVSETQEDGSTILYFCDKPALKDSSTVIKLSAAGWGMSTDGGKTWNVGTLVDGTTITKILNTVGINADWINTGALTVKDDDGDIVLSVDASTGKLIARLAEIGGWGINSECMYKNVQVGNKQYVARITAPLKGNPTGTYIISCQERTLNDGIWGSWILKFVLYGDGSAKFGDNLKILADGAIHAYDDNGNLKTVIDKTGINHYENGNTIPYHYRTYRKSIHITKSSFSGGNTQYCYASGDVYISKNDLGLDEIIPAKYITVASNITNIASDSTTRIRSLVNLGVSADIKSVDSDGVTIGYSVKCTFVHVSVKQESSSTTYVGTYYPPSSINIEINLTY